jgi:hypothetical protein
MRGWHTRTFVEKTCLHHRPMGSGSSTGRIQGMFRHGQKDYMLGSHPLWQISRSAYQMTRSPYVIGGLALGAGYFWALLGRREVPTPPELVSFHRSEQMARLRNLFLRGPANIRF